MANIKDESSTSITSSNIDGLPSGIPTRTTPTLTSSTLNNIGESFVDLDSIPPPPLKHQYQAGFAPPAVQFSRLPRQEDNRRVDLDSIPPPPLEHQYQAGFAPPAVQFSRLPRQEDNRRVDLDSIPPPPLEHQYQAGFAPPAVQFSRLPRQEDNRRVDDGLHSPDRSLDSPRPSSESSVTSRPS